MFGDFSTAGQQAAAYFAVAFVVWVCGLVLLALVSDEDWDVLGWIATGAALFWPATFVFLLLLFVQWSVISSVRAVAREGRR